MFSPVLFSHLDLVVTREGVQKTEEVAASCGVHDLVNSWHGERVLGAGLVHVSVVDAEAPPAVGLGDDDAVGEPCGVCNFSDDISSF